METAIKLLSFKKLEFDYLYCDENIYRNIIFKLYKLNFILKKIKAYNKNFLLIIKNENNFIYKKNFGNFIKFFFDYHHNLFDKKNNIFYRRFENTSIEQLIIVI